jgi:hypothetical protein
LSMASALGLAGFSSVFMVRLSHSELLRASH